MQRSENSAATGTSTCMQGTNTESVHIEGLPSICRLAATWRTAFAIGTIPIVFIIYWRIFRLKESAMWRSKRQDVDHMRETKLLFRHYWHR